MLELESGIGRIAHASFPKVIPCFTKEYEDSVRQEPYSTYGYSSLFVLCWKLMFVLLLLGGAWDSCPGFD